ncbi:MAG: DUF4446 family protein [Propionibacteriales bacterium]|nr:DUF4446 family protein [Propionibacteriales bacterium]
MLVAVLALLIGLLALRKARIGYRGRSRLRRSSAVDERALPEDVQGLRAEVQALRLESRDAMRHLAVVRYDAFGDMGGHLSWSMALLDDGGNGIVLTSIHGRTESRTYAKNITEWSSDQTLSPEEEEAVSAARP